MALNAGEAFVNAHVQRKFIRLVLDNAAGTVTIDATNTDPALINKVEVITSAVASGLVGGTDGTKYTFASPNGTTIFGIGILDGLAKGPVRGYAIFLDNTKASGSIGAMVAADATANTATNPGLSNGVTGDGGVAVKLTFVSTLAALTGKVHVFIEYDA